MWKIILIYLIAINVFTLLVYGFDKAAAGTDVRRVRERTLLGLALFGGSVGAILAMRMFRHKTRKSSFLAWFFGILVVQAILIGFLLKAFL